MTFNANAPAAYPVFYRTYSRQTPKGKESWLDVCRRCTKGLAEVGSFTVEEEELVYEQMKELKSLPSGRWLWVGGTDWINQPENFSGAYNCTSTDMVDLKAFPLQMGLLMMGSGTGAVIEPQHISKLPSVKNQLRVTALDNAGSGPREAETQVEILSDHIRILVGDSRQGWCDAVEYLLIFYTSDLSWLGEVVVDLAHVRPAGTPIKGFGGVSNPIRLAETYRRVGAILEGAVGRQLSSVECCLILDEVSMAVVAGNVRRSAGMRQFAADDAEAAVAKDNLWQQGDDGKWRVDPKRDALRMANHTRVFHTKPTYEEVRASVKKQFRSGEGAIQYAPEAIARSNADILTTPEARASFVYLYESCGVHEAKQYLISISPGMDDRELDHRLGRYGLNPCGEILGKDFHCNLSEVHLNNLDPKDKVGQRHAFQAAALSACALLHHQFVEERYQYSREMDPIIGVSFTGLFDFFVKRFGYHWLEWWEAGRPAHAYYHDLEATYLQFWREVVQETVEAYCQRHGLRVPNRVTTVQPAGTKSLLTGASPGWHPPKGARFIRRITFAKNDPVALACEAYGYSIIPSQSDRDETGALLEDPRDPRCTEWLVEIPTETVWAGMEKCDEYDVNKFSAAAQFDFYMQVQKYYTTHNTSATIEFRESEIDELSNLIHSNIGKGYISAALLARFDANETFPRLPFEPITAETYRALSKEVDARQITDNFDLAMQSFNDNNLGYGPAACDSDKCMFPDKK